MVLDDGSSLAPWYGSVRPRPVCVYTGSQPAVCSAGPGLMQVSGPWHVLLGTCRLGRPVPYLVGRSVCPPSPPPICFLWIPGGWPSGTRSLGQPWPLASGWVWAMRHSDRQSGWWEESRGRGINFPGAGLQFGGGLRGLFCCVNSPPTVASSVQGPGRSLPLSLLLGHFPSPCGFCRLPTPL